MGHRVLPQSIRLPLQSTQRLLVARVVMGGVVPWPTFCMMSCSHRSGFVAAVGVWVSVMVYFVVEFVGVYLFCTCLAKNKVHSLCRSQGSVLSFVKPLADSRE
jgi:hypothetical protein